MLKYVLIVAGIVLFGLLWFFWPSIMNYLESYEESDIENKNFVIVGHRGAAGHAPENTMVSFRKAIELGADWVELDVHRSKDGQLMVMHDATVDRTTNGTGAVSELTFDELRALDAGEWLSKDFEGEKIPSLADAIRGINGEVKLLIEIKWPQEGLYEGLGAEVAEEVHKYGAESWCIIQSFEAQYLEEANAKGYDIPLHKLLVGKTSLFFVPFFQDRKFKRGSAEVQVAGSMNYYHKMLTKGIVEAHHTNNQTVIPYTLNSREQMVKALGMGVDGIITDFPDVALELRNDLLKGL